MDRKELMALFNKRPRIGALSTANSSGDVNAAVRFRIIEVRPLIDSKV